MKDKDFIKTKLDVYNVDKTEECDSAPASLRSRYGELSDKFADFKRVKEAERVPAAQTAGSDTATGSTSGTSGNTIFLCVLLAIAAVAIIAVLSIVFGTKTGNDISAASPNMTSKYKTRKYKYLGDITDEHDVLLPADFGFNWGFVYFDRETSEAVGINLWFYNDVCSVDVDIALRQDYEFDRLTRYDGLENTAATPLFDYTYAEKNGGFLACFSYADATYYVTITDRKPDADCAAIMDSFTLASEKQR